MALRSVNSHFWQDSYASELTVEGKLLFLYLLTGPNSSICGAYECTLRQMAFDTGMEQPVIRDLLAAFAADGKVFYVDGYVVLPNHAKNQHLGTNSELARKKMIEALPPTIREALLNPAPLAQTAAPLAKQFNLIKHNTIELKSEGKKQKAAPLAPPATVEQRKDKFMQEVFTEANVAKFGRPMLAAFFDYWSEENRSGTKMLCELKPTWKLSGRLATWASREIKNKGGGKPSRLQYTED